MSLPYNLGKNIGITLLKGLASARKLAGRNSKPLTGGEGFLMQSAHEARLQAMHHIVSLMENGLVLLLCQLKVPLGPGLRFLPLNRNIKLLPIYKGEL